MLTYFVTHNNHLGGSIILYKDKYSAVALSLLPGAGDGGRRRILIKRGEKSNYSRSGTSE